jgi:hypothetical protein
MVEFLAVVANRSFFVGWMLMKPLLNQYSPVITISPPGLATNRPQMPVHSR